MRVPMPTGNTVQEAPTPDVSVKTRAIPEAFGAVQAQQLQQLGKIGEHVGLAGIQKQQREQDIEDADKVFGLSAQLKQDVIDHESDYRTNRQGDSSAGIADDTNKFFGELEQKYGGQLTTDRQRRLFQRQFESQKIAAYDGAKRWQDQEMQRSLAEKWAANKQLTIDRTVSDPTPQNITAAVSEMQAANQFAAANNKHPPEWVQAENLKDSTKLHASVLDSMITRDPSGAKVYFDQHKDQIAGTEHAKIKELIRRSGLDASAQAYAKGVIDSGVSLEDAINKTRSKFSGQDEDAYVSQVKALYGERKMMQAQHASDLYDAAIRVVNQSGRFTDIPRKTIDDLNTIDPEKANALLRAQRKEIDNLASDGRPVPKHNDYDVVAKIDNLIEAGDITQASQLQAFQSQVTPETLNTFRNALEKRATVSLSDVKRAYLDRGQKVHDSSGMATPEWNAFKDYIYGQVKETHRPDDVEKWADRWFMKGHGLNDSVWKNDPNTLGEARMKGRTDFVVDMPPQKQADSFVALATLRKAGIDLGFTYKDANGEEKKGIPDTISNDMQSSFYTRYALEADRWATAHDMATDPLTTAAYAALVASGKRTTYDAVVRMRQMLQSEQ